MLGAEERESTAMERFWELSVGFPRAPNWCVELAGFFWQVRRSGFSLPVILLLARLEGEWITWLGASKKWSFERKIDGIYQNTIIYLTWGIVLEDENSFVWFPGVECPVINPDLLGEWTR
jgi:hypothetical protein